MMFGEDVSLPIALRAFCQRFFMARTASMIASEEPIHAVPTAVTCSFSVGEWKRLAKMLMQRCSISTDFGYSSWSMTFLFEDSAINFSASSSWKMLVNFQG